MHTEKLAYLFRTEALGIPEILPNQLRVNALMDAVTRVHSHGAKAKDVLGGVASILSGFRAIISRPTNAFVSS